MEGMACFENPNHTVLKAAQAHSALLTAGHNAKISRDTMVRCVEEATALVDDNDGIVQYSRQLAASVVAAFGEFSS
jgi:hypothetical protein